MRWTRLTLVITEAVVTLSSFMAASSGQLMGRRRTPWRDRRSGATSCPGWCSSPWLAAWAELRRWLRAGWLPVVAGVVLAGWIAVQVAMIGLGYPMQPSLFVAGVAIAGLGWRRARNQGSTLRR
jgi:hypothetical protein